MAAMADAQRDKKHKKKPSVPRRILYRQLSEADKQSYWYVDLPDDRPTSGRRVSQQEWFELVNRRIRTRHDGVQIEVPGLWGDVIVGSTQWKESLRDYATSLNRRLFWEPRFSLGLTEEGARRYGGNFKAKTNGRDPNKPKKVIVKRKPRVPASLFD